MSPDFETLLYARDQIHGFLKQLLNDKKFRGSRADKIEEIVKDFYAKNDPEKMRSRNEKTGYELSIPTYPSGSKISHNYICALKEWVEFPDFRISHTLIFIKKFPNGKYKRSDFVLELTWLPSLTCDDKSFLKEFLPKSMRNSIRKRLKSFTTNRIILSRQTSKEDILAQLIVFASRVGFIENAEEIFGFFKSYFLRFRPISVLRKALREEVTRDVFNHLALNCTRPIEEFSFKAYVSSVMRGIIKLRNRSSLFGQLNTGDLDAVENNEELKRSKNLSDRELYDPALLPHNDSYLRFEINGDEALGVDRVAIETRISRDTIYRYIREGKIKAQKVPTNQGECLALTQTDIKLLKQIVSPMKIRQALIQMVSRKNGISSEGARKRIFRLEKKGYSLNDIYSMHKN